MGSDSTLTTRICLSCLSILKLILFQSKSSNKIHQHELRGFKILNCNGNRSAQGLSTANFFLYQLRSWAVDVYSPYTVYLLTMVHPCIYVIYNIYHPHPGYKVGQQGYQIDLHCPYFFFSARQGHCGLE